MRKSSTSFIEVRSFSTSIACASCSGNGNTKTNMHILRKYFCCACSHFITNQITMLLTWAIQRCHEEQGACSRDTLLYMIHLRMRDIRAMLRCHEEQGVRGSVSDECMFLVYGWPVSVTWCRGRRLLEQLDQGCAFFLFFLSSRVPFFFLVLFILFQLYCPIFFLYIFIWLNVFFLLVFAPVCKHCMQTSETDLNIMTAIVYHSS